MKTLYQQDIALNKTSNVPENQKQKIEKNMKITNADCSGLFLKILKVYLSDDFSYGMRKQCDLVFMLFQYTRTVLLY